MGYTPPGFPDRNNHTTKRWKKVLPRPGFPAQSAEFTEIQSILQDDIGQLAGALYREGAILSGCTAIVDLDSDPKTVTITAGQVYAFGLVHDLPQGVVEITGTGLERVGVRLVPAVVTEDDDPDLLDPIIGAEAYGYAGAHRLVFTPTTTVDDPKAITLYELQDGAVIAHLMVVQPVVDAVRGLVRTHTWADAGSYVLEPFAVEVGDFPLTDPQYNSGLRLLVKGGVGSVRGLRVSNHVLQRVLPRALTYQAITDAAFTYASPDLVYALPITPIRQVTAMRATVEATLGAMVRGTPNGCDAIPLDKQPVVSVEQVKGLEAPWVDHIFTPVTDYTLNGVPATSPPPGDYVNWHPAGGDEPAPGDLYEVTLRYTKTMAKAVRTLTTPITGSFTVIRGGGAGGKDRVTPATSGGNGAELAVVTAVYPEGAPGSPFVEGDSYLVEAHTGKIDWSPTTAGEPAAGEHYVVECIYWAHTVEGDYVSRDSWVQPSPYAVPLPLATPSGTAIDWAHQVSFDVVDGDLPIDPSVVLVDYECFLPRYDLLTIDSQAQVRVVAGIPALHPAPPTVTDVSLLPLLLLYSPAEARAAGVRIIPFENVRPTAGELQTAVRRAAEGEAERIEFALHHAALHLVTASPKSGVIADPFVNFAFCDLAYTQISGHHFAATLDPLARTMALPRIDLIDGLEPDFIEGDTTAVTDTFPLPSSYFTLPYDHLAEFVQPFATVAVPVNPQGVLSLGARVAIAPASALWDLRTVRLDQPRSIAYRAAAHIRHIDLLVRAGAAGSRRGDRVSTDFLAQMVDPDPEWLAAWQSPDQPNVQRGFALADGGATARLGDPVSLTALLDTVRAVLRPVPFAQQQSLYVHGQRFAASEDNIVLFFDGLFLSLTPAVGSGYATPLAGTLTGSVKAGTDGQWYATCTVPSNIVTGTHVLVAVGAYGIASTGTRGFCYFRSEGLIRDLLRHGPMTRLMRQTALPDTTDPANPFPGVPLDQGAPLAQTFTPTQDMVLTKLDLFFQAKSLTANMRVLVCDVVNGLPGHTVYGAAERTHGGVNTSANGSVATVFTLDHPVFLTGGQEYCLVLDTDDPAYIVWGALPNQSDAVQGWANFTPGTGVCLRSLTGRGWTLEAGLQLKMTLYRASFSSTSAVVSWGGLDLTSPTAPSGMSQFVIAAETVEPYAETQIQWQYSLDNLVWETCAPNREIDLGVVVPLLYVRALLTGTERLSPALVNDMRLSAMCYNDDGDYVIRAFTMPEDDAWNLDVWMIEDKPAVTTIAVEARWTFATGPDDWDLTGGGEWKALTRVTGDELVLDSTWKAQHYHLPDNAPGAAMHTVQVRVVMGTANRAISPRIGKFQCVASQEI